MSITKYLYRKFGIEAPYALSSDGWDDYEKEAKKKAPIIYWIGDKFLPKIKEIVTWPYARLCDVRYFLYNGFIAQTRSMKSSLKFGAYHEVDTRMLHCTFDTFVNFIEVEKAWMNVVFDDEAKKKFKVPFWRTIYLLRWGSWRCPEAGLGHLRWEIEECENPPQAESAKEQLALYNWWKARDSRPDPWGRVMEISDEIDSVYGKEIGSFWFFSDRSPVSGFYVDKYREALDQASAIEKQYEDEDDKMLLRLIKIRHQLWT